MTEREMTAEELREQLADYAHDAWSGWMRYMLGILDTGEGPFGTAEAYLDRWRRQMGQEYGELPDDERESDRREADRMLAIMRPHIDTLAARLAAVEGAARAVLDDDTPFRSLSLEALASALAAAPPSAAAEAQSHLWTCVCGRRESIGYWNCGNCGRPRGLSLAASPSSAAEGGECQHEWEWTGAVTQRCRRCGATRIDTRDV